MVDKIDLTDCFKNTEITAIPDKQIGMTDEEIMKALENCTSHSPCCPLCKYDAEYDISSECMGALMIDALDLLNRKDAEIDIILRKKEKLRDEICELQAENERLKHWIADKGGLILMESAKVDAIKEFAERLKSEYLFWKLDDGSLRKIIPSYAIDYLVAEMTE